jgi:hypothetical protein
MGEPGRFIVSLDCEGKWGMADHLQPYHHQLLTEEALAAAYRQLTGIFARHGIAATFAFVMAFVLTEQEREEFRDQLLGDERDEWLRPYRQAVSNGELRGWHQPAALDIVRQTGVHEIACHSFCHRPLGERSVSSEGANRELDAAAAAARLKGLELETFVFPRNEVGHLAALKRHGFIGYRQRLRRPPGQLGRALGLAEEFNLWAPPQQPARAVNGLVPIPSGRFLNWRFGLRGKVPPQATAARWRHQLRSAAQNGGVVHLWLHPHNLITGPGTAALLENVLAEAGSLRDRGEIRVLTQRDYCREQLALGNVAEAA